MQIFRMSAEAGMMIIVVALFRAAALCYLPKTTFLALWSVVLCRLLIPIWIPYPLGIHSMNSVPIRDNELEPLQAAHSGAVAFPYPMLVWAGGCMIVFAFFTIVSIKSRREIRKAVPLEGNPIVEQWLCDNKLRRPLQILQSDTLDTPVSAGILKPCIIFPASIDWTDTQTAHYVLTHELEHLKHFDMLWKIILNFALCIHWFNPLVWLMFALANRDLEIACDARTIRCFGTCAKAAYAQALVNMMERRHKCAPFYSGFGNKAIRERIVVIMKLKRYSVARTIASVAIVFLFTLAFAVTVMAENEPSPAATSPHAETAGAKQTIKIPNLIGKTRQEAIAIAEQWASFVLKYRRQMNGCKIE